MYKVLIIDNNIEDCTTLEEILRGYNKNFKIMVSDCGDRGLEIINKEQPNVVFVNMTLPILDGVEICNIVKNRLEITDLKVILISEVDNLEKKDVINVFLADDYLSKPYENSKVGGVLDRLSVNK